ncbi:MAG: hypothetical protein ACP5RF_02990 [Candidatus Micrarchaeia archaeon]
MKYARPYVKRYWIFEHKKALGLSFIVFAVVYSIGLMFTTILNSFFLVNITNIFTMALLLFILAALVIIGSLVNAHNKSTHIMSKEEHAKHSKHVGIFFILMILGSIGFLLPLIFDVYPGSLLLLFSAGGILLLLYAFLILIFDYKFYEIAIASIFLWAIFIFSVFFVAPIYYLNAPLFEAISLLVSSVTLVTVFAVSGIVMLHSAANEFLNDFKIRNKI